MKFSNTYLLIPKDKFYKATWLSLYNKQQEANIDFSDIENCHYIVDSNLASYNPYILVLTQNTSNYSNTADSLKFSPFFEADEHTALPKANSMISASSLYAININYNIDDGLSKYINENKDVAILTTDKPLGQYTSDNIMRQYRSILSTLKLSTPNPEISKQPKTEDEIRNDILSNMLAKPINVWIDKNIKAVNIEEKINEGVEKYLNEIKKPVMIKKYKLGSKKLDGLYHKQFKDVLELIQIKEPLFIYGNAGSGKTKICIDVANALELEYRTISVNEQSTKTDFLGYFDAHSNLIRTPFRDMYENGGVFILDEIDAGNPNVLTVLNSALSNGIMAFPDGMVQKHKDFICICTANTTGDTANIKYVGRNILDSATLDRFIRLEINYDRELENAIISKTTQKLRDKLLKIISELEIESEEHIVSSRTVFQIDKLLSIKTDKKLAVKLATNFGDHIINKL